MDCTTEMTFHTQRHASTKVHGQHPRQLLAAFVMPNGIDFSSLLFMVHHPCGLKLVKGESGQRRKRSRVKVVKGESGQERKRSRAKVVKGESGQAVNPLYDVDCFCCGTAGQK